MRIQADDLASIFDIVEDDTLAIDSGKLRRAGQRNRRHHLARCRVDHRHIFAAPVEGPYRLRSRFKDDAVGVGSGRDSSYRGQRSAIKDHYRVAAAVRNVAKLARRIQRHAVRTVQPGDGAYELAALCIHDIYAHATRQIEPVRRRIGQQIIPSTLAADLPVVNDFVRLLRGCIGRRGKQAAKHGRGRDVLGKMTERAAHGSGKLLESQKE